MARLARSTIGGFAHHIVQRSHYCQPVFDDHADYLCYLDWLRQYALRYGLSIWAFCLMPDHVHVICVPHTQYALARIFNCVHMRYTRYIHAKKGVTGRLWRPRFLSCILDEQSAFEEIRHIETDPVRSGYVRQAEDYLWSSARCHVLGEPSPLLTFGFKTYRPIENWQVYLTDRGDESVLARTRECLRTGRPSGSDSFIRSLEIIKGRRLIALPRGRPRKADAEHTTRK